MVQSLENSPIHPSILHKTFDEGINNGNIHFKFPMLVHLFTDNLSIFLLIPLLYSCSYEFASSRCHSTVYYDVSQEHLHEGAGRVANVYVPMT